MLRKTKPSIRRSRRGYTLMEMLMVQGMIVALVALSWPSLRNPLGKNELLDAARKVRVELAKTRLRAIETGTPQEFRYQLGGRDFGTGMESEDSQIVSSTAVSESPYAEPLEAVDATQLDEEGELKNHVVSLPSGIHFSDSLEEEKTDFVDTSSSDSISVDLGDDEGQWSQPIVFYPNGRASNHSIRLHGKEKFFVEVALRGLTGEASVGDIKKELDEEDAE